MTFLKIQILLDVRTCRPIKRNRPWRWKHWLLWNTKTIYRSTWHNIPRKL